MKSQKVSLRIQLKNKDKGVKRRSSHQQAAVLKTLMSLRTKGSKSKRSEGGERVTLSSFILFELFQMRLVGPIASAECILKWPINIVEECLSPRRGCSLHNAL